MKKETVTTNQITEGVIWKQLLLFFFPIVLGTFFQQLYNTADTIVVGRFVSKEALAAVGGSAAQIVGLIVGFFVAGTEVTKELATSIQNAAVSFVWIQTEERNVKVLSNMMVDLTTYVDCDPEELGVTELSPAEFFSMAGAE